MFRFVLRRGVSFKSTRWTEIHDQAVNSSEPAGEAVLKGMRDEFLRKRPCFFSDAMEAMKIVDTPEAVEYGLSVIRSFQATRRETIDQIRRSNGPSAHLTQALAKSAIEHGLGSAAVTTLLAGAPHSGVRPSAGTILALVRSSGPDAEAMLAAVDSARKWPACTDWVLFEALTAAAAAAARAEPVVNSAPEEEGEDAESKEEETGVAQGKAAALEAWNDHCPMNAKSPAALEEGKSYAKVDVIWGKCAADLITALSTFGAEAEAAAAADVAEKHESSKADPAVACAATLARGASSAGSVRDALYAAAQSNSAVSSVAFERLALIALANDGEVAAAAKSALAAVDPELITSEALKEAIKTEEEPEEEEAGEDSS